jgi:hypothetical protein
VLPVLPQLQCLSNDTRCPNGRGAIAENTQVATVSFTAPSNGVQRYTIYGNLESEGITETLSQAGGGAITVTGLIMRRPMALRLRLLQKALVLPVLPQLLTTYRC